MAAHVSQSIDDWLRYRTANEGGRCLHSGDITLKTSDDRVEVSDQILLDKLSHFSTCDGRSRLTWPAFWMSVGDEFVVICEIAVAASPETLVTMPMFVTTCWTVSAANAP